MKTTPKSMTSNKHVQFITDKQGKKISVVLPIKDYKAMLEELEELEDIRLYDEAKKSNEVSIPIDDAFKKKSISTDKKRLLK